MYKQPDFGEVVKKAFSDHGVSNPELEKALTAILYETVDTRKLSRRIYKNVKELIESDEKIVRDFNS